MTGPNSRSDLSRRAALAGMALGAGAVVLRAGAARGLPAQPEQPAAQPAAARPGVLYEISLAQWSLHRALQSGELAHMDFPKVAKDDYGIDAVEYVSTFFKKDGGRDHARDLRKRCDDLGVKSLILMVDGEGDLGDPHEVKRGVAVENHYKWAEAAAILGCHSIRVNARSAGTWDLQLAYAADSLRLLCQYSDRLALSVIVENHGGLSSNGKWEAQLMRQVNHPRIGTLPDFGNFRVSKTEEYDRYQGVQEMMPWAKGVSAKSYDFNDRGEETMIDYRRMMKIVVDAGYKGRVGIEYEGDRLSEPDGIKATKKLLERVREEIAATPAKAGPEGK